MNERTNAITFKGKPLTLLGYDIKVGDAVPDVTLRDSGLSQVTLSSFEGKVCVISTVPSLDTPTCDAQTRRFNQEATKLGDDVVVITVSVDLPFAQGRWCGAAGVENIVVLSDYFDRSLGQAFGVLIKELQLLARAVFVINREGVVDYVQIVNEMTEEPDYQAVLEAIEKAR